MAEDDTIVSSTSGVPIQQKIEIAMKTFHEEERWESIFLFSSEGLLMASHGTSPVYGEENLLEFAHSLIDMVRLLEDDLPIKEITIRGKEGKKLIFRYFNALEDKLVLAAVASGKRGFRRAMGRLVKLIRTFD